MTLDQYIEKIPKAELHLHIEGSFEPELMFKIADRNKFKLNYNSIDELKGAYQFNSLQEFLDIYYEGANVLITDEDFYELAMEYFKKINDDNVIHTEIMFDPQTHTDRGVKFSTVINGIKAAQDKALEEYGITSKLIMSYLRHLDEKSAFQTLSQSLDYKKWITAVGLDSSEMGNPPSKFTNVFKESKNEGYITVAHAGEEGPAEYVWEALDILKVTRVDHGNKSLSDPNLVKHLVEQKIPLTVCPLSNIRLKNVDRIENHPIKKMLDLGIVATVNSDDPAYFGGYMTDNFKAVSKALELNKDDIFQLAQNSFNATFTNEEERKVLLKKLDDFHQINN